MVDKKLIGPFHRPSQWGISMVSLAFRFGLLAGAALILSGCVATETARFVASANQTSMMRDGRAAISSVQKNSLMLLSRAGREIATGERVGFVIAIQNRAAKPLDFRVEDVRVIQSLPNGGEEEIAVLTYEKLRTEERNRQVARAIFVGLAAGANAAAAANAGYYRSTSTIYTPRGTYTATTTGYNPALASIAQANAANQNAQMIDSAIEQGRANLASLEREYVKDHTLLPGEWYGGLIAIEPPKSDGEGTLKQYRITVRAGADSHTFTVIQQAEGG